MKRDGQTKSYLLPGDPRTTIQQSLFRAFCFFLLFLIVPQFFISVIPASAEDAQFRANPEHTGVSGNGGIVPGNTELWRFATGGVVDSSPAVANGIVYVGSEDKKPVCNWNKLIISDNSSDNDPGH